ncbi:DUF1642 domain-containing protein [Lactococcus lactis]|nr:DUF1642 domain-containing protein [Lactococcus lactis]
MNSYDGEFTASDIGLNIKLGRVAYNFPWLEFAKNWHSEEEFQELLGKYSNLNDNYEKEVIRSSKLESQITGLKSQLQQQALPVVPECVAGTIESIPDNYSAFEAFDLIKSKVETLPEENKNWLKVYNWLCEGIENQDIFALAFITRKYQVEKPQLFYLKNKITGMYLSSDGKDLYEHHKNHGFKFTQEDINSLDTGSYEQIEVTE